MYLIVGLGNPGPAYEKTPHNVGFIALDQLAKRGALEWQPKFASLMTMIQHLTAGGEIKRTILLKPQLFMNRAGKAVAEVMRFYKIRPADLWIIHDELDLPLGALKITFNRSSAGHKGVESIIRELKTQSFYRVRLGVMPPLWASLTKGGPEKGPVDPDDYLTNAALSLNQQKLLAPALDQAGQVIDELWRGESIDKIVSWANKKPPKG